MLNITLSPLHSSDIEQIVNAFNQIGWHKPASIYDDYLNEQANRARTVIVAKIDDIFCGYVTIKWQSAYQHFAMQNIPEIADLNVLPRYRNQGIGTSLIQACEHAILESNLSRVGIGVGLTSGYGHAQRLYVQLGFIPDGHGVYYENKPVNHNELVPINDHLILYLTKTLKQNNA